VLVGAGPGDPELLTVKAVKAIEAADVVLYDNLVSQEVLDLVPPTAKRIRVGKKGYGPSCRQDEINGLMLALAASGWQVVRLKSGDPLIFARAEEEIGALQGAGIAFEVIPGISAAQGAAARLKMPLTRRGSARRFQVITGHAKSGGLPDDLDWSGLADPAATTAVYMPKATIRSLCSALIARGLPPDHPATAVFDATRAGEAIVAATLLTLPDRLLSQAANGPCIVLIGCAPADKRTEDQTGTSERMPAEAPDRRLGNACRLGI